MNKRIKKKKYKQLNALKQTIINSSEEYEYVYNPSIEKQLLDGLRRSTCSTYDCSSSMIRLSESAYYAMREFMMMDTLPKQVE